MWHMGDGWGWWMGFGSMWMVGFWAVIIWAVFTLGKRWRTEPVHRAEESGSVLDILERRYARGALSDEQFEMMRARLIRSPEPIAA